MHSSSSLARLYVVAWDRNGTPYVRAETPDALAADDIVRGVGGRLFSRAEMARDAPLAGALEAWDRRDDAVLTLDRRADSLTIARNLSNDPGVLTILAAECDVYGVPFASGTGGGIDVDCALALADAIARADHRDPSEVLSGFGELIG